MNSGKLVVNTNLSSIDVKSGDLVINDTVGTVNVVKTANVIVAQGAVVNKVEVSKDATGTVIENAGKIENVVSNAPNVSVENNGTVGSVSGTDKPSVDGNPVKPPSSGGGSSNGGGSSEDNTEKPEEKLFKVDSSFTKGSIEIGITPSKDMNIGLLTKDNIKISYLDESEKVIKSKDKNLVRIFK